MYQAYPSSPPSSQMVMAGTMPYVQVHNDMYQMPMAPVSQYGQPAYLQEDYYQPEYSQPVQVPVPQPQPPIRITTTQTPLRAPKPRAKVRNPKPAMAQSPVVRNHL